MTREFETLPNLLAERQAHAGDRPAITVLGAGQYTFAMWHRRSEEYRALLLERGITPGSRIVLRFGAQDWFELAAAFIGSIAHGAVAVPVSSALTDGELQKLSATCRPAGVIARDREGKVELSPAPRWPVADTGEAATASHEVASPDAVVQLLYTSGTTGDPKCIAASHANLVLPYEWIPEPLPAQDDEGAIFHAFPVGTNAGQSYLVGTIFHGRHLVVAPTFHPSTCLAAVSRHNIKFACITPTMAALLLRAASTRELGEQEGLTGLGVTGAAAAPSLLRDLRRLFPNASVTNYYTSTEAWPALVAMEYDETRPSSVGRPQGATSVVVRDSAGEAVAANCVGEIWLYADEAPGRTYWGDQTGASTVFVDGWTRTGDLGYLDDAGYLFITDRQADTVNVRGWNVSTLEVEFALTEHPAVEAAAVVGIPGPVETERVVAALVLRDAVESAELDRFLRERLADYKVPERFVALPELPLTPSGKVSKRVVAAELAVQVSDQPVLDDGPLTPAS